MSYLNFLKEISEIKSPNLGFTSTKKTIQKKNIKDVTNKVGDGIHSTPKYDEDGDYFFINGNNLESGEIKFNDETKKISLMEYGKYKEILSDDSILLSINGTIGNLALYNKEKILLGKSASYINVNNKLIEKKYLFYVLQTKRFKKYCHIVQTGSTIKNLSLEAIRNFVIDLPEISEQNKIVSFFNLIDKKIELLTKKHELLVKYKKGLMQKLFSQEIRFKQDDGNNFPEWKNENLGKIGKFSTSSVNKLIEEGQKKVKLVNYMNVYNHETIQNETKDTLMTISAKENQIISSDLRKSDILFTPSSETPDDIGRSVVIKEDMADVLFSYHLVRFRPSIKLDLLFSHYFCNTYDVLKQFSRYAQGATRYTLPLGLFSKVIVKYPMLEEQQKIGSLLSLVDKKIGLVKHQIEKTQTFKKGLLQQMFV